jgi:hypothetical protein
LRITAPTDQYPPLLVGGGASLTANRVFCKKVDFLVCFACYISWLAQAIWLVSFLNKTNT